uniref:Haloacid dehalogenase-like hydrolase n=1 Tax=Chaetoceros debilis TaxID=122233 RepID=A0A7S3PWG9_9STRA|mmetsp:Transcript_30067/g.46004  ORF Transcript_30067/g.46004 Transcript_30067/m.46004 type:complete len:414 (-) Transcript_30067:206-1447(-)
MRLSLTLASITLISSSTQSHAFSVRSSTSSLSIRNAVHTERQASASVMMTTTESSVESDDTPETQGKSNQLAILTFDLDDTLYPISTIIDEANSAFARSMKQFGFDDIVPSDIVETGKRIRSEMAEIDPERSACLTHTETRQLAIREEMEKIEYQRKLQACADDWATNVSSLSPLVVENAKKWATRAISPSVVQAVLNAWEMERHHAAERHLYPEVMDMLEQIREEYPNVVIGAVTDGKANPLFMTFTLAKYFDFCVNWEDDQAGRKKFFTDLGNVEKDADLKWIYSATKDKGMELVETGANLRGDTFPEPDKEYVWIHVGDDLALDVGGAATCGAKTILTELADKQYHQTARHRFDDIDEENTENVAAWSITPKNELLRREKMNEDAMDLVDKKVAFLSHVPEAIKNILNDE